MLPDSKSAEELWTTSCVTCGTDFECCGRAPAVSAIAVLALALGIGANSAIFSVVYAVLLRPLPVHQADRLVAIQAYNPKFNIPPINPGYSSYGAWQKQASSFEQMAASWAGTAELGTGRSTEKVVWWRVTASFFPAMGVQPALGRWFCSGRGPAGRGAGRTSRL